MTDITRPVANVQHGKSITNTGSSVLHSSGGDAAAASTACADHSATSSNSTAGPGHSAASMPPPAPVWPGNAGFKLSALLNSSMDELPRWVDGTQAALHVPNCLLISSIRGVSQLSYTTCLDPGLLPMQPSVSGAPGHQYPPVCYPKVLKQQICPL